MGKTEEIEAKIRKVVDLVSTLKRENQNLSTECASLRSHIAMLTSENNKAQRILTDHEQLRRKHEQATHRIERALHTLNALRTA